MDQCLDFFFPIFFFFVSQFSQDHFSSVQEHLATTKTVPVILDSAAISSHLICDSSAVALKPRSHRLESCRLSYRHRSVWVCTVAEGSGLLQSGQTESI